MYPGTRHHGKSRRSANATLTAGLRCAPETLPMNRMIASTISPGATTAAVRLMVFGNASPIMPPPAATNTRKNVPSTSEKSRRHSWRGSRKSSNTFSSDSSVSPRCVTLTGTRGVLSGCARRLCHGGPLSRRSGWRRRARRGSCARAAAALLPHPNRVSALPRERRNRLVGTARQDARHRVVLGARDPESPPRLHRHLPGHEPAPVRLPWREPRRGVAVALLRVRGPVDREQVQAGRWRRRAGGRTTSPPHPSATRPTATRRDRSAPPPRRPWRTRSVVPCTGRPGDPPPPRIRACPAATACRRDRG